MGEARQRKERLRKVMIDELTILAAPPTAHEAAIAAELQGLTASIARRESAARLAWANMKPQQCHQNVAAYVRLDPDKSSSHQVGWWQQGDQFVLHSVARIKGQYICLTPQQSGVPDNFPFLVDPKITQSDEGEGVIRFLRDGIAFPHVVRGNPERIMRVASLGLERISLGIDPNQVWNWMDQEINSHQ